MKNFTFEQASAHDAKTLAAIETQHTNSIGWGFKGIISEIKQQNSIVIKASAEDKIVGFITAKIIPPEVQITNIAIDKKYLRRRIGLELIKILIRKSKKLKCIKATLEVDETNIPAFELYIKTGFKVVGRRPKFYNGKGTAILMDLNYV